MLLDYLNIPKAPVYSHHPTTTRAQGFFQKVGHACLGYVIFRSDSNWKNERLVSSLVSPNSSSFAVPTSRTVSELCVLHRFLVNLTHIGTPQGTSGGNGSIISPYYQTVTSKSCITYSPFDRLLQSMSGNVLPTPPLSHSLLILYHN